MCVLFNFNIQILDNLLTDTTTSSADKTFNSAFALCYMPIFCIT